MISINKNNNGNNSSCIVYSQVIYTINNDTFIFLIRRAGPSFILPL